MESSALNHTPEIIEKIIETEYKISIITNKQIMEFEIDDGQRCCEHFGINSEKTLLHHTDYTNAEITKIVGMSDILHDGDYVDFTINTTKGIIIYTAYNCHNGYYTHNVWASWKNEEGLEEYQEVSI